MSAFQTGDVPLKLRKRLHRSFGIDELHCPLGNQAERCWRSFAQNEGQGAVYLNLQERSNLLRAGAVFGKVAVLYDVPQMFTVRTLEVCELLKLDKAALTRILKAYPEDNRQMLANLHQVSGAAGANSRNGAPLEL